LVSSLKDRLKDTDYKDIIVVGIPRGGAIVADSVAKELRVDHFDIIFPRKIGLPQNKMLSFGAIIEDGIDYFNQSLIDMYQIKQEYIGMEETAQLREIERRKKLYRKPELEYKIKDRIVIIVDDGAFFGSTVIVAARWIKTHNPRQLLIALPVAPKETVEILKEECDSVIVVTSPTAYFRTALQYYQHFPEVTDDEVIEVMRTWNLL
jgi:putative phosphoribosyl transferase